MKVNKKNFTLYKDPDNDLWYEENNDANTRERVEFCVKRPDRKTEQDAQVIYNRELRKFVREGAILQVEINKIMKERGLWNDDKEAEYKKLSKKISDARAKLSAGNMRKQDAYALAVSIIKLTNELNTLNTERNALNSQTAESQADNSRFNYYISNCTLYANGDKYYESYDDLLDREDDNLSTHAGLNLMELLFRTVEFRKNLPEYKFLTKYNFCDEDLRLKSFDTQNYVNLDGRVVDKEGYFLNDEGERVDEHGNPIKSNFDKVEFQD